MKSHGSKKFLPMREAANDQPVEKGGAELRSTMMFLKSAKERGDLNQ